MLLVVVLAVAATFGGSRGWLLQVAAPKTIGDIDSSTNLASPTSDQHPLRVAVLGTSLTQEYTWPDVVAGDLEHRFHRVVHLTRAAKSGATSDWGRSVAGSNNDVSRADVVLVEFLANDADALELMTVQHSRRNHLAIIDSIRGRSSASWAPNIVLMTMNPVHGLRGHLRQRMPSFAAMYAELARETGVGLLDLTSRWNPSERFRDGLHPSDAQANAVVPSAVIGYLSRSGLS